MSLKSNRITTTIAMMLVFATSQVYLGAIFAGPGSVVPRTMPGDSVATTPQQTTGILTTQGNKGITVNGATAIGGATIISGASIETPAGVGATISLGSRGSVVIEPNTKLTLEFDQGMIKVMLIEGCVTVHSKKGTTGEIDTPQGVAGKTDPAKDGKVEVCPRRSAAPIVAAAGAGGLFGLGTAATVAIIAGGVTAVVVPVIVTGRNPSPFQ